MPDLWVDVDAAVVVPVNILPLLDDTTFKDIETAVAYNAAGMALTWNFQTCAGVVTGTAVTPTTGGVYDWSEPVADKGMYAIEIPASGGASINNDTEGVGWFTGVATGVLPWRGPTIGFRRAALNDLFIDGSTASTNMENFFNGTGYAGGTAKLTVDVTKIDGQATAGNNATLNLKQLNIVNSAGSAIIAQSTGSNGHGLSAQGNGSGQGIYATSGTGPAIKAASGTGSHGIMVTGQGAGDGINVTGGASGHGIYTEGGSGHGIYAYGTDGLRAEGFGNGNGINAIKAGTGKDILAADSNIGGVALTADYDSAKTAITTSTTIADADSLPVDSLLLWLRRMKWTFTGKLSVTDASGAFTLTKDDGTTAAGTGSITDDSTTTVRTVITWA